MFPCDGQGNSYHQPQQKVSADNKAKERRLQRNEQPCGQDIKPVEIAIQVFGRRAPKRIGPFWDQMRTAALLGRLATCGCAFAMGSDRPLRFTPSFAAGCTVVCCVGVRLQGRRWRWRPSGERWLGGRVESPRRRRRWHVGHVVAGGARRAGLRRRPACVRSRRFAAEMGGVRKTPVVVRVCGLLGETIVAALWDHAWDGVSKRCSVSHPVRF